MSQESWRDGKNEKEPRGEGQTQKQQQIVAWWKQNKKTTKIKWS
jgi:hypothetical protein